MKKNMINRVSNKKIDIIYLKIDTHKWYNPINTPSNKLNIKNKGALFGTMVSR